MGPCPQTPLWPGQFRIKMVFLNAQLFRRCLIIAEQQTSSLWESATSTPSRKHRWQASRRTKHRSSTSFLLQLLKACARSHLTCNLTQVVTGGSGGAESNLFWRSCMSLRGQLQGHSTSQLQGQPKQHVRTQPVCHELRRHRPYSRSYQIYSPISRNLNDGDKISPHPSYFDGAATIISLCALCNHSQLGPGRSNDIFY